ncbi:hypothetical protein FGO68_gene8572 [Halteria grandinella]|uniref:Thymidine kinase n=1 Tax=Halteria grandinella TaxID=5974 RepID=A0A8J8NL04_HALGN|nr:hypothetical protein FGO68_gene8572 [Halteria grandinella]
MQHSSPLTPPSDSGTNSHFCNIPSHHEAHQSTKLRGHIELICGPMFSGKSTELLRRLKRYEIGGHRILRVKFAEDTRYSNDSISTHDRQTTKAVGAKLLSEIGDLWTTFDVIGIDEGQFFEDVATFAESAANTGKVVIVAALDTTCVRTMFPTIVALLPKCEKVKKLQAICRGCNHQASFHIRTAPKHVTQMIGGEDMYKPMCRECYHRMAKEIEEQELIQEVQDKITLRVVQNGSQLGTASNSGESTPEKIEQQ